MSTLRVNNLQNTSTTDGGISINNSGHVTVDGVAMPSAGPLSNRNLVINGAMQVAQRGSAESTTSGYSSLDRWQATHGGSGSMGQSQQTLSSGTPYNEGFRYFMRLKNNSVVTSFDNSSRTLIQYIEAQNVAGSGWNYTSASSYITLSFWVRSSIAQNFYGFLRNHDGTSKSYPFETGSLTANTWTKITKTVPGHADLQFDNDNGTGLELSISPYLPTANTDSSVTLDAWMTRVSSQRTPDYTQTWASTADATFDITGVQLEVGSVATPFEHRSYGDELRRCQRYYWNVFFGDDSSDNAIAQGTNWNGNASFYNLYPPVAMRTTPSLEASNTASYYIAYESGGSAAVSTITLDNASTPNVFEIKANVGGTAGNAVILRRQNAAAILRFSAEL